MNQPMSACSWVTSGSGKPNRGSVVRRPLLSMTVPASGPLPVTTVPAASISVMAAASSPARIRRSARTSGRAGPAPSPARACSTTAAARIADDSRKCTATIAGFSLVSTTMPPATAWAITPLGRTADSQARSRRRRPPGC